jgi:hypothetical protein
MSSAINLIEATGIVPVTNCAHLKNWENAVGKIGNAHAELLETARLELADYWNYWNEEEVKMNFVSVVLLSANANVKGKIKTFYERKMIGTARGHDFSIICDCMIATPTLANTPKIPYFFLQEFKKSKADSADPEAQMLVAMLLAQEKNKDEKPVYGAWQQGKNWYFAVLNGNEYCLGTQFDATNPESLNKIVYMLQALQPMIIQR